MSTEEPHWDWNCASTYHSAICTKCGEEVFASLPAERDRRVLVLMNFLAGVDAHEEECWGYVIQPWDY